MPRQPGPRLHRLPQRLDYTLIPAPLDLSLPSMTEKSPLPAIIVTPSSPSSSHDYSIAFLAPPKKPTILERLSPKFQQPSFPVKARTALIIFLILFVMVCHVVTHRIAARRPHLDFSVQDVAGGIPGAHSAFGTGGWFDLSGFWGDSVITDDKRDFVIREAQPALDVTGSFRSPGSL